MLEQHLTAHLITQFRSFCRNSASHLWLVLFKVYHECLTFSTFAKLDVLAPFVRVGNASLPDGLCCIRHLALTVCCANKITSYFVFCKIRRKNIIDMATTPIESGDRALQPHTDTQTALLLHVRRNAACYCQVNTIFKHFGLEAAVCQWSSHVFRKPRFHG